jgi:hypothetical protein
MSTKYPEIFEALAAEFDRSEVKSRKKSKQGNEVLWYITARTAQNRLDAVLGPENWWPEPVMLSDNSFLCKLTLRLPDGTTVSKSAVGGMAGMSDAGDDDKSGDSDALKRAAVLWGVGRYLYGDGVPSFARDDAPAPAEPTPAPADTRQELGRAGQALWVWATNMVPAAKDWWLKALASKGRECPKGHEDILNHECHLLNHLVKWARDSGRVSLPEGFEFKPISVVEVLAPLWIADQDAIRVEAWRYVRKDRPAQIRKEVDRKAAKAEANRC